MNNLLLLSTVSVIELNKNNLEKLYITYNFINKFSNSNDELLYQKYTINDLLKIVNILSININVNKQNNKIFLIGIIKKSIPYIRPIIKKEINSIKKYIELNTLMINNIQI